MKNLKLTHLTIMMLLILFSSCEEKDSMENDNTLKKVNYSEIKEDASANISILQQKIGNKGAIENDLKKYFKVGEQSLTNPERSSNQTVFKITLAPHYDINEAAFMLDFYQDLANSYDENILNLLDNKRIALKKLSFDSSFKEEVNLIIDVIEETTLKIYPLLYKKSSPYSKTTGFWDCMEGKGKDISRGIATGAITGAVSGAYTGATGGTVAFPGIGTAAGAIGGAVFGAAAGAVGGATTATVWAAVDCWPEAKPLLEKFPEDRLELDQQDIKFINNVLDSYPETKLTFTL
ncbi:MULTISPECIES: hypothetical protein [unclassified Flavobacterium]|uniref:hypothetical protein n=1 Tax=unclassified Flavobacterium TaxID=196869 RepID=UPI0006ABE055|nr:MULTISPECIES: hypothetical protein [unclassified Flavobacterium]OWU91172.1 hypothetical protein APR43_09475 [Flavobacterium sp. NLM]